MNKKDILKQILLSCGISVMISSTASIVQYQLFIKKCNKAFEKISDDIEELQSDVDELKKTDEKILSDIKNLKEEFDSLNIRLTILEEQQDKVFNDNLKELKMNMYIDEEIEQEIKNAYLLNKSEYVKGGDFIIALNVLDCEIYGEDKKYVLSTFRRNDNYKILRGISNPEILIFGIKINGEYIYYSLTNNYLIVKDINTDVEKYFTYVERIPNEEPAVSYEEIKYLENDLNNSNKLTRKY